MKSCHRCGRVFNGGQRDVTTYAVCCRTYHVVDPASLPPVIAAWEDIFFVQWNKDREQWAPVPLNGPTDTNYPAPTTQPVPTP